MKRLFKYLLYVLTIVLGLFFLSVVIILLPPVQNFLIRETTDIISAKTGTFTEIQRIRIGIMGSVILEEFLILDQRSDTLIHCGKLDLNLGIHHLIKNKLHIDHLKTKRINVSISRSGPEPVFNYQFLLDSLSGTSVSDSTKSPKPSKWQFYVNKVSLLDTRITYTDDLDSIKFNLSSERLSLNMNDHDFKKLNFNIQEIVLENAECELNQYALLPKRNKDTIPTGNSVLPLYIMVNKIRLRNSDFTLNNRVNKFRLETGVNVLDGEEGLVNLSSKNIDVRDLISKGIYAHIQYAKEGSIPNEDSIMQSRESSLAHRDFVLQRFGWDIETERISIKNGEFSLFNTTIPADTNFFNTEHIDLKDITVHVSDVQINDSIIKGHLSEGHVHPVHGPEISDIKSDFLWTNQRLVIGDASLQTKQSLVRADARLSFINIFDIKQWHRTMEGQVSVDPSFISPGDIRYFINNTTHLKKLDSLSEKIMFNLSISGTPGNYQLQNLKLSSGMGQHLEANGGIVVMDSQQVSYNLDIDTLNISEIDKLSLLIGTDLKGNLDLPEMIAARVQLSGSNDSVCIESYIQTETGDIDLAGDLYISDDKMNISGVVDLENVELGKILSIDDLGKGNAMFELDLFFLNKELSKGSIIMDIKSIAYNKHNLGPVKLTGNLNRNQFNYHINTLDQDLLLSAFGKIDISDTALLSDHYIRIENCDLEKMNLIDLPIRFSSNIHWIVDYKDPINFSNHIDIDSIRIEKKSFTHTIPRFQLDIDSKKDVHSIDMKSTVIDSYYRGNMEYEDFRNLLFSHFDPEIVFPISSDSINHFFEFAIDLKEPDFLVDDILEEMNEIDITEIKGEYTERSNRLLIEVDIPKFSYNQLVIDSLSFLLVNDNSLNEKLSISKISYDTFSVSNISVNSSVIDNQIASWLTVLGETSTPDYYVGTLFSKKDSTHYFNIISDSLIINGKAWRVSENNFLRINKNNLSVQNTELRRGEELIGLRYGDSELVLQFANFELRNISGIIDSTDHEVLFEGRVNGEFVARIQPFDLSSTRSDIQINDFEIHGIPIGSLELVSGFRNDTTLSVFLKNTEKDNTARLEGFVFFNETDTELDLNLNIDFTELKYLNSYTKGSLSEINGILSAEFAITNKISSPEINGRMNFTDVSLRIDPINKVFSLIDEKIAINKSNIIINNFTILDSLENPLLVDGTIDISEFDSPEYDVKISSDDFLFVNSTVDDNDAFYGQLWMDLGVDIKGDNAGFKVNANLNVLDKTNMVYVMEGDNIELESDVGIVYWGDIDTDHEEELMLSIENAVDSVISQFAGIDFTSKLTIGEKAQFMIITNPFSGDYATFRLNGLINYTFSDGERSSLIGALDFKEGKYQLSFYGLVKKDFILEPGSSIRWSGPIMDGDLNLSAKYVVNTNSVGLMSSEVISDYEKARYSQRFPYEVSLDILGIIDSPDIGFGVDLPERYKQGYPDIGSKLDQLNQDGYEGERNKQVFALLVVGAFLAESTDDGSGSGAGNVGTTAARNSINGILTQQLNNMTGQGFMGFDLNLGVNTFDDYAVGSTQTRTQLDVKVSRKLYNDRVTVEAETKYDLGNTNNDLTGYNTSGLMEFSVFYDLTKEGNYRIKAFRENAYDLLDGEIQNTGVSFIMMKEFDKKLKESEKKTEPELNNDKD